MNAECAWRKSSYSDGPGGSCVEVTDRISGVAIPIRDSKTPAGPALGVPTEAWADFTAGIAT
ncbi:DUF397 domain-containing protein [Streptomyces sp. UNOC14_S4]|nr:DUF397 domain-containing protein [Streptomyces sp. UNOC14_S4]